MISLRHGQVDAMYQAIAKAYPNEACGLLVGRTEGDGCHVDRIEVSDNVADDPRHRFEVDPALRFRLMRDLRGTGQAVVGHFHSHPDGAAEPSATALASMLFDAARVSSPVPAPSPATITTPEPISAVAELVATFSASAAPTLTDPPSPSALASSPPVELPYMA